MIHAELSSYITLTCTAPQLSHISVCTTSTRNELPQNLFCPHCAHYLTLRHKPDKITIPNLWKLHDKPTNFSTCLCCRNEKVLTQNDHQCFITSDLTTWRELGCRKQKQKQERKKKVMEKKVFLSENICLLMNDADWPKISLYVMPIHTIFCQYILFFTPNNLATDPLPFLI